MLRGAWHMADTGKSLCFLKIPPESSPFLLSSAHTKPKSCFFWRSLASFTPPLLPTGLVSPPWTSVTLSRPGRVCQEALLSSTASETQSHFFREPGRWGARRWRPTAAPAQTLHAEGFCPRPPSAGPLPGSFTPIPFIRAPLHRTGWTQLPAGLGPLHGFSWNPKNRAVSAMTPSSPGEPGRAPGRYSVCGRPTRGWGVACLAPSTPVSSLAWSSRWTRGGPACLPVTRLGRPPSGAGSPLGCLLFGLALSLPQGLTLLFPYFARWSELWRCSSLGSTGASVCCCAGRSVVSPLRARGLQPAGLLCTWGSLCARLLFSRR